ncbi:hypothetical protein NM688_g6540 [Phlebia brevispora]|uniref:Uncharacterized protein n=1 Tax=Phlebia brevispora TaxID=194682 RepID=A0ACC1SEX7_9APHY|nr:hypothetical protein NM688_g6540 [Phlebia brevispora]
MASIVMLRLCLLAVLASSWLALVRAQPSPQVQKRITQAIKAAANATSNVDYTQFVNVFIGTDNFGDVCPGASIPFGMVKVTTDFTGYAPAGYVTDNTQLDASPGYFSLTLDNNIQMEATSTRRAALERFTFPKKSKPYFALDLSNDLPGSFAGGSMNIDPEQGRITMGGLWGSSWGPGRFNYQAFACYDLNNGGNQSIDEFGIWTANEYGLDAKGPGQTTLNFTRDLIGDDYESGALFSFKNDPETVIARVGISFVSVEQACANAENEIGDTPFEDIVAQSKALWNEKLSRIELDLANTPLNVTEMFYSSFYRSFLTPNNATDETQGPFVNTTSFYFDSLYCSWDTFRTFYPLMSLHSPVEFAQIVDSYIDAFRKNGWIPECRANHLPGWTQGGSSGDVILGQFAMTYHDEAEALGIDLEELYSAILADANDTPPTWDIQGRQAALYNDYGYVPFAGLDASSVGRMTREGSRTLEYAFEDFAIRQVALLLNKSEDVNTFTQRALSYRNVWDPSVTSDGFQGFAQKRFMNGSFAFTDPTWCSPVDNSSRSCSLQPDNTVGFYESSSWEYSWFVPHDTAHLIELMGGNDSFVNRLNHFFSAGYYYAGNEPSFQTPIGYHYANHPAMSVDRVRDVVFTNFDITPAGLPGNDDQGAMATVLAFHLLGFYPVPSSSELLVMSPFTPKYTIHNTYLNVSTTVTVNGFDKRSVQQTIPKKVAAYVSNVTINGVPTASRCHIDFYDVFKTGGDVVITVTADQDSADDCEGALPQSLSTVQFYTFCLFVNHVPPSTGATSAGARQRYDRRITDDFTRAAPDHHYYHLSDYFACTTMDNLVAVGIGLGMRALIDSLAGESYSTSAIVGIWEGVVLNHFLAKYPTSIDPYLAYAFRLFIDFLFAKSMTRIVIILLWTFLGMLLADVAIQMSEDRRFRRLGRHVTRIPPLSWFIIPSRSRSSRVRFNPSSTTVRAARRAGLSSAASDTSTQTPAVRPTTHPLPGRYDQYSEVSAPTGTGGSVTPSQSTAELRSNPPRPRTPSDELDYIEPLPVIPDTHDHTEPDPRRQTLPPGAGKIDRANDTDAPSIHSGLTTPVNEPVSLGQPLDDEDKPAPHSGLTTPENKRAAIQPHTEGLPAVVVYDTEGKPPANLPDQLPVPIRLTLADPSPPAASVSMPEPQPATVGAVPLAEIPSIPTLEDAPHQGDEHPPSYPEATGGDAARGDALAADTESHIDDESVITTTGEKPAIIQKADELRKQAKEKEKERDRIRAELHEARREKRHFDAFRLEIDYEEAQHSVEQLHAKAARRFYRAHNLNRQPHEVDVHRLQVTEAMSEVKRALKEALESDAPELRIITGRGNHSKGKLPILKPTIKREMEKHHINPEDDPKNPGVLVIKLPASWAKKDTK